MASEAKADSASGPACRTQEDQPTGAEAERAVRLFDIRPCGIKEPNAKADHPENGRRSSSWRRHLVLCIRPRPHVGPAACRSSRKVAQTGAPGIGQKRAPNPAQHET